MSHAAGTGDPNSDPRFAPLRGSLQSDGRRQAVHPADVSGRFTTRRNLVFATLIAVYVLLPWIEVGGHPAVFLDVVNRKFFLFGATFNAQDVWLTFFLLTGIGFALIVATALMGRIWCGYACPQTVFLEGVFRRFERWLEGPAQIRIRRNRKALDFDKLWRKVVKHAAYVIAAALVAHVFLSYFVSLPRLFEMMTSNPLEHVGAFVLALSLTGVMYFNFAFAREQTCLIICPYGRLQSVLTDADTMIIGYDESRGEPRGKAKDPNAADCIDCGRCVAVCPTGIDIRNGLQLECIGCAACVDACDEIMDKVKRPRGLVRYDSLNGLHGKPRRFWRPRLALYGVLGALGLIAMTLAFTGRTAFEANLLRAQGMPFVVDGDTVRNSFTVHLVNKRNQTSRFELAGVAVDGVEYVFPVDQLELEPLASMSLPVVVAAVRGAAPDKVQITVTETALGDEGEQRALSARFLGPR